MADSSGRSVGSPVLHSPWLWLEGVSERCQTTLMVRRRIELDRAPGSATIRLAANHFYRLYVNGTFVGRGPVRSDPRLPFFDTYDLTGLLKAGENVVLVLVHHFNWRPIEVAGVVNSGRRLYNGPGGLWASVEIDGRTTDSTSAWEARLAPGWEDCRERISRFLGYQHEVDLSAFEPVMADALSGPPAGDERSWHPMTVQESPRLGQPSPLPMPALVETVHEPLRVMATKTFDAAVQGLAGVQRGERGYPLSVVNSDEAWLTFDFGRPMGGFPELELECQGDAEIDVYMGEAAHSRRTDRLRCSAGRWHYQPLDWRGGRTVTLHVRPRGKTLAIHAVRMIEMVYPFQPVGDFACSDPALTAVWQVCRQTTWAAVKDHLVDCVGREQALWIADVNIHARAIHAAFGDMRPVEKSLRQALQVMHDDGIMPVPGPGALGFQRTDKSIPWSEQPMTVAMTLRDLYRHTGSLALAGEAIGRLDAMYRNFAKYEDARGLLVIAPPGLPRLNAFGGWNPFYKEGVPAAMNFEYVQSLEAAAELAAALGWDDLAGPWRDRAVRTRAAAVQAFWDPARKLFIDAERDGKRMNAYSSTVNAWAALGGGVPAEDRGAWAEALRGDPLVMPPVTPYDASLLLEAFAVLGLDLHARDLLDRYFGSIVRAGEPALPEFWMAAEESGVRRGEDSSDCHPYGAGPTYLLHEHVLGVTPLRPGFATAQIAPRSFGLNDARGRVPTPHGPIAVEWRRSDTAWRLRIELPHGVAAELRLPRSGWVRERLLVNGQLVWKADASAYVVQRARQDSSTMPRTIAHALEAGGVYEVELRTI